LARPEYTQNTTSGNLNRWHKRSPFGMPDAKTYREARSMVRAL
jgi:hypothetical protein